MKAILQSKLVTFLAAVMALGVAVIACGQGMWGYSDPDKLLDEQKQLAANFKAGQTNGAPRLKMYWLSEPKIHVNKSGQTEGGDQKELFTAHWCTISGTSLMDGLVLAEAVTKQEPMDSANLLKVAELIAKLPPPPEGQLPPERRIIVGGPRSNQWFYAVYDRENTPVEVKRLYEITEGYFVPLTNNQGRLVRPIK